MADMAFAPLGDVRKFRAQSWSPAGLSMPALREAIGAEWPCIVGAVAEGRCRVLCIGPADWIVVAPSLVADDVHGALRALESVSALSVVEVSDALPAIRLSGAGVRDVLSQGCGLDLHPRFFPAGRCARTRFAQVPVILHCIGDESGFDCYVSRSFQGHLTAWLEGAR